MERWTAQRRHSPWCPPRHGVMNFAQRDRPHRKTAADPTPRSRGGSARRAQAAREAARGPIRARTCLRRPSRVRRAAIGPTPATRRLHPTTLAMPPCRTSKAHNKPDAGHRCASRSRRRGLATSASLPNRSATRTTNLAQRRSGATAWAPRRAPASPPRRASRHTRALAAVDPCRHSTVRPARRP